MAVPQVVNMVRNHGNAPSQRCERGHVPWFGGWVELPASYGYTTVRTLVETGALGGAPGPIGWYSPCQASRSRRRCRRYWRRVLTGSRPRISISSRPRQSSVQRCHSLCYKPLPRCPRRDCPGALTTCKRRSCSTRRGSSRARIHLQACPDPRGGLWRAAPGAQRVLHARIVKALEVLYPDRLAEQVDHLAHHAVRGEVWAKAPSPAAGRPGWRAEARSAHREAVTYFE